MLRFRVLFIAVVAALLSWPQATQGQRFPTRSSDLNDFRGDRVRVIVQGVGRRALGHASGDGAETAADLGLIRGFSASLGRDEILRLAEMRGVRRISLDREVVSSAYDQNHLRATTGGAASHCQSR